MMTSTPSTGAPGAAQDPDCDLNGIWVARMLTVTQALGLEQCASLYYYLEFRQDGPNVEIVNHMNCGIEAIGSARASFSTATRKALLASNSQVGRKGTFQKGADGTCELNMESFWSVIGADEAMFTPMPRNSMQTLQEVQSWKPLPMLPEDPGVVDFEGDNNPGVAFVVTEGPVNGRRHGDQRNVQRWITNDRYKITPALDWTSDIEARAEYLGEEYALAADDPFLTALAAPVPASPAARITLRFLGRSAADPRVAPIVVGSDPADADTAMMTCTNVMTALPVVPPLVSGIEQVCPCSDGNKCQ